MTFNVREEEMERTIEFVEHDGNLSVVDTTSELSLLYSTSVCKVAMCTQSQLKVWR